MLEHRKCTEKLVRREYRVSVHIPCGAHEVLYKLAQNTGTELSHLLGYRMSRQIVDQKCSVFFSVPFSCSAPWVEAL